MWNSMGEYAKQVGSFFILVGVQSAAILLFKLCQKDGKYTFNPASSVALTELCKLALAGSLHYQYVSSSKKPFFENVNTKIVVNYLGLSFLYTVNNQLSFYCLELADPGSMALGKSIAPYLCALLLRLNGQMLHALQWVCVIVQCCAIAIVQYDACKGTGYLPLKAYYMIGCATTITAVTSVWNQLIIKGFEVPVNLQNSIMYASRRLLKIKENNADVCVLLHACAAVPQVRVWLCDRLRLVRPFSDDRKLARPQRAYRLL